MKTFGKVCALGIAGVMTVASLPATLAVNAQAATVSEQEPNGTIETANEIAVGDTANGTFSPALPNDTATVSIDDDYYKFTITKKTGLILDLKNDQDLSAANVCFVHLYNSQKREIESFEEESGTSFGFFQFGAAESQTLSYRVLPAGTYYLDLSYTAALGAPDLPYHFELSYKDFGTSITSLKAGKQSFTAKWAGKDEAAYYQVRYTPVKTYKKSGWKKAKKKRVSKSKTSIKVAKLKAKTSYKVQVRAAYESDEDMTGYYYVYSDWSGAKTVKTK